MRPDIDHCDKDIDVKRIKPLAQYLEKPKDKI